jgi:hypothetical protein
MSSKESAKFWHAKCQELEAKMAELEKINKMSTYDAKYWKAEYRNLFDKFEKMEKFMYTVWYKDGGKTRNVLKSFKEVDGE